MKRIFSGVALLLMLGAGAAWVHFKSSATPPPPGVPRTEVSGYVDSKECASCHSEIAETFQHSGMGRSFSRPNPRIMIEDFKSRNTYYHAKSDRYYTMIERGGRYFQRRHELGFDGKPVNIVEKEIHYILGSGNHVRTYLQLNEQKKLVELPVAWYSEKGGYWAMNPGYDRRDHQDFRREVTLECMFCHNAYPESKVGLDRSGSEAVFDGALPEGIDCQRCHGPGAAHIRAVSSADFNIEKVRNAIVNPARLSSDRKLEVCMQCHLESTSTRLPYSLRRFGRGVFSYRPGEVLSDYIIHFDHQPGSGRDDKFEIVNQAYRLRQSACFQKSGGAMTCTTCHDPHNVPRGDEATRHYASVCRGCHQDLSKTHPPARDCLTCHMPKRRTDDVVHVVMTDHHIQRRKPSRDLLALLPERHDEDGTGYKGEVVLYYPPALPATADRELYLALAQVKQNSNLKDGIPRLRTAIEQHRPERAEFYFELGEAYWEDSKPDLAIPAYRQALERAPDFWPALHKLGLALSRTGQLELAVKSLEQAASISNDATVLNDLALVYRQKGDIEKAIATLKKAVARNPDLPQANNNLGGLLRETGDMAGAEQAFRGAIQAQPELAAARTNLGTVLVAREQFAEAQFHLQKAINDSLPQDPSLVDAHNALGDLMSMQGKIDQAAVQYQEALKIQPEFAPAHFSLGSILAMQGKKAEALSHLQKAAQSTDPTIRQPAQEALRKLRP